MKPIRSLLTGLALAACACTLHAETFPVQEDASADTTTSLIKSGGKSKTMAISAKSNTYLFFDVGTSGIAPASVSSARLIVFFPTVKAGGTLSLHKLATGFAEFGGPAPAPGTTPFKTLVLTPLDKSQFAVIDVTTEVKAWLTTAGSDKGFAFTGDATVNCQIASKEGAGSGHPPVLEVELSGGGGGGPLTDGSVTTPKLADAAVTSAKLASGLTLGGTTSGTFSGNGAALTNLNVSNTIADGSITSAKLASGLTLGGTTSGTFSGNGAALTNLNVSNTIPDGSITSAKLASGLTLGGTTNGAFSGTFSGNGSGLTNLNVSNTIADGSITSAKLASNLTLSGTTSGTFSGNGSGLTGVTSTFADGSVTTAKLANTSVTSAKLASDLTLTGTTSGTFSGNGAGLTNLNVSNTIADGSITTAKLANASVTAAKLDASTVGIWSVSGANVFRSTGNVGIGVAAPSERLEVAADNLTQIIATGTSGGGWFLGRAFNGTLAAPTAVVAGDTLASFRGKGHDGTTFVPGSRATMSFVATQNWTTTAQGTEIQFATTANGTAVSATTERMRITHDGNVRIGFPSVTIPPSFNAPLHVINNGNSAGIEMTTFIGSPANGLNWFLGTAAGGTPTAPSAVTVGQDLISIRGRGYNSPTSAGATRADMTFTASENWSGSANGTEITFTTTPNGTNSTTERMRIFNDGRVGIGTTSPNFLLSLRSPATNGAGISFTSGANPAATSTIGQKHFNVNDADPLARDRSFQFHNLSANGAERSFQFLNDTTANLLTILASGPVGIGTNSPTKGKLQVEGFIANAPNQDSGWLYTNTGDTGPLPGFSTAVSIYASNWIWSVSGFVVASDARTKNIQGRSDGASDLRTLLGIEITDYIFKDVVSKGRDSQKKVIAQQVETVFSQAVTKHTDSVPDIYQKAEIKDGWVTLATNLKQGERVRLIGKNKEGVHEVLEVREDRFRTDFATDHAEVFVYGREVKDFRAVDYDAISMLNVSATQELARKLEAKDATITRLNAEVAALKAADKSREARLTRLENALGDRPVRTVRASLDRK